MVHSLQSPVVNSLKVNLCHAGVKRERRRSPAALREKLIGDISNSCSPAAASPRTSHFLSFIDIYGATPPGCRGRDSSLSKAPLGLFAAAHRAIMHLSPRAKCHPLRRSSFAVPFSVQHKQKCVLLSRGRYRKKTLGGWGVETRNLGESCELFGSVFACF